MNRRNKRWLCAEPVVMNTKFTLSVMVPAVVRNEDHIIPLYVFLQSLYVNTIAHIEQDIVDTSWI